MSVAEFVRAQELFALTERAQQQSLAALSDDELMRFLAEHRWAIGRLAEPDGNAELRSLLNAAVLRGHGLLHRRAKVMRAKTGTALRRVKYALVLATVTFFGTAALTFLAVRAQPVLALALVPRELLSQMNEASWGNRGSLGADIGMTLFYWGNNLRASFLALCLGVLAGVPALLVLAYNGVILGAVAASAAERGALDRLIGWVLPHGVPEISALILCAALGLSLGLSWVQPGSRSRAANLAWRGRELLPLMLVAATLVICAAPLEGFVAPLELPRWLDVSIATTWCIVLATLARYALLVDTPPSL